MNARALADLAGILDPAALLTDGAAKTVYSTDASHLSLGRPGAVLLPRSAEEVGRILAVCHQHRLPVVCRGSGTGLSGGAVPAEGEVVLSLARLAKLDPVDAEGCRIRVAPGVLNEQVSIRTRSQGLEFAPDPSSQSASSIGGNIAENAGGPHCLRHGVTQRHLLRLEWCDARGRSWNTGRGLAVERGIDLTSLLCGSEGTLGVVTAAELNLVPTTADVATLLAIFPRLADATRSVVTLLGAGVLPVAVEIVDRPILLAVEEAFAFGFPTDVEAAMIVEFAGSSAEVDEDAERAAEHLAAAGAREVSRAADEAERADLWRCRKKAFGAVGRLAPRYVTMDVVVPLGLLPTLVQEIQEIKTRHGVGIATSFHAGDGNLHPGVHYDDRDCEQARHAHLAADEIIARAVAHGGSVTGEHGIGIEKLHVLPLMLDRRAAQLMQGIKDCFDPEGLLNPGKGLVPASAEFAAIPAQPVEISFQWENMTVRTPAGAAVATIQALAAERGMGVPLGIFADREGAHPGLGTAASVGALFAHALAGPGLLAGGTLGDFLLEIWAETGDGHRFHAGAPVFKNVAGFDLTHALCGSGGMLADLQAATLALRPLPEAAGIWDLQGEIGQLVPGLMDLLRTWAGAMVSPTCILELGDGGQGGRAIVVAGGRRRSWDLERLHGQLQKLAGDFGLPLAGSWEVPFATCRDLMLEQDLLPDWARSSATWTHLGRLPSPAESIPGPAPAWGPNLVWQGSPRLWWVPRTVASSAGRYADTIFEGGRPAPVPKPGPNVPLELLVSLKELFDPQRRLPTPAWLGSDRHA